MITNKPPLTSTETEAILDATNNALELEEVSLSDKSSAAGKRGNNLCAIGVALFALSSILPLVIKKIDEIPNEAAAPVRSVLAIASIPFCLLSIRKHQWASKHDNDLEILRSTRTERKNFRWKFDTPDDAAWAFEKAPVIISSAYVGQRDAFLLQKQIEQNIKY